MSIAVVQSAQAAAGSRDVAVTGVSFGHLLVVFYSDNSSTGASIADTMGTTYQQISHIDNAVHIYLFWGLATSSGSNTITITSPSGTFENLVVVELSGASSTIDAWRFVNDFHDFRMATSTHQCAVLAYAASNHTGSTFTVSGSTTTLQSVAGSVSPGRNAAVLGYQFCNTAGLQSVGIVENQSETDTMLIIASFLPSSSTPVLSVPRQGNAKLAQSVAFRQNVVSGNLIVVCFGTNTAGTPSISDTIGTTFTYFGTQGASGNHGHVWYGVAPSSGADTVTISSSWTFPVIAVCELLNATTIDVSITGTAGATAYSVTTTQAYDALLTMFAANHSAQTFTEASPAFRLAWVNGSDAVCLGFQIGGSAAGTEISGITTTNADNGAFFIGWKSTATYTPPPSPPAGFTVNPILSIDTFMGVCG